MKRILVIILALVIVSPLAFAGKRAFLVGISKYKSEWSDIHGSEDVKLLDRVLKKQGFQVTALTNENATHDKIINGLVDFINKKIEEGDVVYIHFSTHGQPVEDYSGDEKDKWDESIVPYDAGSRYSKTYQGDKHIIDDTINKYVHKIRTKLGPKGALYVVMDACHAGNMSRDGFETTRGTNEGLSRSNKQFRFDKAEDEKHYKLESGAKLAPTLFLEACTSKERNSEISVEGEEYGSLSYMVYLTLKHLNLGTNPVQFEHVVKSVVKGATLWPKKQTLVTETSY